MIIEQSHKVDSLEEGEDMLEGWNYIETFMLGYIRVEADNTLRVIGIFKVTEGAIAKGQRIVNSVHMKLWARMRN
jgi:hypothetical protein